MTVNDEVARRVGSWTIRKRILFGFGSVIALLFLTGAFGTATLRSAHRNLQASTHQVIEVKNQLFASQEATRQYVVLAQNDLLHAGNALGAKMDSASDLADSLRFSLNQGSAISDAERGHLAHIGALQGRIGTRLAVAKAWMDVGNPAAASTQTSLASSLLDSLFAESNEIIRSEDQRAATLQAAAEHTVSRQLLLVNALLGIGLLAALIVGFLTLRAVTEPLDRLTSAARQLGEGNLQSAIDPEGLDEEYRVLAQAFADTTERLSTLVQEIQQNAADVTSAAEALTAVSGEAAESTGRFSEKIVLISQASEEQRRSLAATLDLLSGVRSASAVLDATASEARTIETEVKELTNAARTSIGSAAGALTRARDVIGASLVNVERVETASAKIQQFLQTLGTISEQTDLLALNAAIEAARAGASGRGFAVVAEEVRKLADHSTRTAEEVGRVVTTMRKEVNTAVVAFREGVSSLGDVDATSRTVTEALDTIHRAIARMDQMTTAVSASAESNRNSVQALNEQVMATSAHAESQATSSEQARSAAEETAAASEEVAATAHELSDSAHRLNTLVAAFTVGHAGKNTSARHGEP